MKFGNALINTIEASGFELLCARLFGKKSVKVDEFGMRVTLRLYRGKLYLMGYEKAEGDAKP